MLDRAAIAADKRAVAYSLTPAGAAQVTSWRQTNTASLASALAALTPRERQVIHLAMPVLNRLVALLDEHTDTTNDDEETRGRQIG